MSEKRPAYWTYDPEGPAYYFAPQNRAAPPYLKQVEVTAILDIAADGTLAGVELVYGDLPAPPGKTLTMIAFMRFWLPRLWRKLRRKG